MNPKSWPWFVPPADQAMVRLLAEELGIHRLTAATLVQRGLQSPEEVRHFLACDLSGLGDPFAMAGAETAAARLAEAVKKQEKTLVFGDYDVDGITATALLVRVLQNLAVPVEYYIPSRFADGYGLQGAVLEQFAADGGRLAVTVDCGINSFTEMELAQKIGLDLIVTDHHQCFPGLRQAVAVLNPKQPECSYPERGLAGVGVAWTLVRALYARLGLAFEEATVFLDLVAVGTIADVVPLLGENRILVKHGLARLRDCPLPGFAALARVSGLPDTNLTAGQVAFTLAPRMNAAGRLGEAAPAVRLLLSGFPAADELAQELDAQNRLRQQVEKEITAQAKSMAEERSDDPALVLWHEGWNPGVVGIVAGRLASEYERPVALIALEGEEGRGSIRTVPGCNVVDALHACAAQLVRFGGHPEAAGFTVEKERLHVFREAFCRAVTQQEMCVCNRPVAAEARLEELSLDLERELASLAPFGAGNPEPLFLLKDVDVASVRRVGARGKHLRLMLRQCCPQFSAIFFGGADLEVSEGNKADVVTALAANTWQGRVSLSLIVKDLRAREKQPLQAVHDRRNTAGRDAWLAGLSAREKLLIWVNTKAAKDCLEERLGTRAAITQLGREPLNLQHEFKSLVFYHLPFDRAAVERLLKQVQSGREIGLCLCYGTEDLTLNEKVFAATLPSETTLSQLAACLETEGRLTPENAGKRLAMPVTSHLIGRAQAVFAEIKGRLTERSGTESAFAESPTYREGISILESFRAYQRFWWEATPGEIEAYLENPEGLVIR